MSTLYLIPVTLGDSALSHVIPVKNHEFIRSINYFIVEDIRTARRFLKKTDKTIDIDSLTFFELNKHTDKNQLHTFLEPIGRGCPVGLMSEAGCPGIADPGAEVVRIAHSLDITVAPLVGPSSILLALIASGMNGQYFAFNGYLPIKKDEKTAAIKKLERLISTENQSQIFIETPYRNQQLFDDLLQYCQPSTLLCIACDLTLETEFIQTKSISNWRMHKPDINKRFVVFVLGK